MRLRRLAICGFLLAPAAISATLAACGSSSSGDNGGDADAASPTRDPDSGGPSSDAAAASDGAVPADAAPAVLTPCPTADAGAFTAPGDLCFNFTPVDTGASAAGQNATVPHYAVRSSTTIPTTLVLFFSGSGGNPRGAVQSDPAMNLYAAAVANGHAVLGLSYRNDDSLGHLCDHNDSCYLPSREAIILGKTEPDAALTVAPDESIVDRAAKALRYLASGDPSGGWGSFLTSLAPTADPAATLAWNKILVVGHSQGGGHAAAIGKLFPVVRVIQLSSTCDSTDGLAASWTNGSAGTWASDPTHFYGLATPSTITPGPGGGVLGDMTCPYHTLNWTNLGMVPSHRDNDASTCGVAGDTHPESLKCSDNYPLWLGLFK